jgi:hypothetical protein
VSIWTSLPNPPRLDVCPIVDEYGAPAPDGRLNFVDVAVAPAMGTDVIRLTVDDGYLTWDAALDLAQLLLTALTETASVHLTRTTEKG